MKILLIAIGGIMNEIFKLIFIATGLGLKISQHSTFEIILLFNAEINFSTEEE